MAEVKKTAEGVCPFCGSKDIDYRDSDFEDGYWFYKCICEKCKKGFTEVFKTVYDGYNTYDENGNENLFDADGNLMEKINF